MRNFVILHVLFLMVSCAVEEYGNDFSRTSADEAEVLLSASVSGTEICDVRSILSDEIETRITDVTLASYDADGLLTDTRYYESGFASMPLDVSGNGRSNVYALVNMGDMTGNFPANEEDVPLMEYRVGSYSEIDQAGFPMSGILTRFSPSSSRGVVDVERLFSKLCVRVLHESLSGTSSPSAAYVYNMCNKSMFVRQANRKLLPFSPAGSRALYASDIMNSSDYNSDLNDRTAYEGSLSQSQLGPGPGYFRDTTIVLYVPENVQGNLLPDNTDPYEKVHENISDISGKSYSGLCTYLEFNARREATLGYSGSVMYRYYLGADNTSDFSIERNKRYDITLDFTEEGFFVDSWKVSRGDDWSDQRILEFVEDPFRIEPGGTERIMVHYKRNAGTSPDSDNLPAEWTFVLDETAMKSAGLSWSFDPNTLVEGTNGGRDFCINVSASGTAKVGRSIPVRIISCDGGLSDESSISIIDKTDLTAVWSNSVDYVAQEGVLSVEGVDDSDLPLTVSLSDDSKVSYTQVDDNAFNVVAHRTGDVIVTIRNASGSKTATVCLSIKAPVLDVKETSLTLDPDGKSVLASYAYMDINGNQLKNVNTSAFETYLKPVVAADAYFQSASTSSSIQFEVGSLYVDGVRIGLGESYDASVSAVNCSGVVSDDIRLVVSDPFPKVQINKLGSIDDYTLFASTSVPAALRSAFSNKIKNNESFEYQGFVPDAESQYVSVSLEPDWGGNFSGANGVFKATLDFDTGKVNVKKGTVSSAVEHSAGRHSLMIYVTNRHSLEKIGCSCGTVDVYVHTAIGARAVFGAQKCGYNPRGTQTFAAVYNTLAGRSLYGNTTSEAYINYMDVTLEWMTDVSKVYVLGRMKNALLSGGSLYDGADMIQPAVDDGQTDSNTKMLYSTCQRSDNRVSVCGEKYSRSKGVGTPFYRALLMQTSESVLSDMERKYRFFGCQSSSGPGMPNYAARYVLYDVLKGTVVSSREPYYFTPSALKSYVDDNGRGYHVIHFLEEIYPNTCGWINLL